MKTFSLIQGKPGAMAGTTEHPDSLLLEVDLTTALRLAARLIEAAKIMNDCDTKPPSRLKLFGTFT